MRLNNNGKSFGIQIKGDFWKIYFHKKKKSKIPLDMKNKENSLWRKEKTY